MVIDRFSSTLSSPSLSVSVPETGLVLVERRLTNTSKASDSRFHDGATTRSTITSFCTR